MVKRACEPACEGRFFCDMRKFTIGCARFFG